MNEYHTISLASNQYGIRIRSISVLSGYGGWYMEESHRSRYSSHYENN